MYPLLPWKLLSGAVGAVVAITVYVDDLGAWFGYTVPDRLVVRLLPLLLLGVLAVFFGPTGYLAPWRVLWRLFPGLGGLFPDLNGTWVGTTSSNWPTIKRMMDAAQSRSQVSESDLHNTVDQRDALAVRITCSLFRLSVAAGLSSTDGESHSITARPWRHQHTGRVHISYVYEQRTPDPVVTDEETHLGAADLILESNRPTSAEGVYWTRRSWKTGRNTAGKLELRRISTRVDPAKTLRQAAGEHRANHEKA